MREVAAVLIPSSSTTSPPNPTPLHPRRRHHPNHRRPYRPNPTPRRPPLLSDTRHHLLTSSSPSNAALSTRNLLKYYAALASKLAGAGKLDDFLMIAESVLASDAFAEEPSQFVARIHTKIVARGLAGALRERGVEEVVGFLGGVERLGIGAPSLFDDIAIEALAVECRKLVSDGRVEEFVVVMETLSGYQFQIKDIVDPLDILKIFAEKRDPAMAVRYASLHSHSQLLFCSIIHEFGKKKDLASALKAFEDFKKRSGGFNMFACRSMIDICGLCGDFLRSRDIFEELLAEKITLNTYFFNSLMNVNAHDLNYTLYVYKHMQNLGMKADTASYNILLKACCLAKRVDLAQDIYKDIKLKESTRAIELDVITYSTMIKTFADAKMPQMALDIKEDMISAGVSPNIVTWSSLIGACAKAGLVDQAVQVFEEMLLSGCEPNSRCCNNLLYACVQSCQYDRAFRLFNSWKLAKFRIFHAIKDKGCHNMSGSQYPANENVITQMEQSSCTQHEGFVKVIPFKPTVTTFNILMKACGSDYYHAKHMMDEMQIMGLSPNHISWSTLIDICGSMQNMSGAMQAFKTMRDVGIRPDVIAYTIAIKACVESRNVKIAFSLFEEMKRYRLQPNLITYNTLLRARRRYGSLYEVQQCLAIYQDMRKAGYHANDYYLKELLEEWCEGVISGSTENRDSVSLDSSFDKIDMNEPWSLLLEKVAAHLQKDIGESRAIDLRGLTKVEARIVVLSVLRMIKENYGLGLPVKDDMVIITGVGKDSLAIGNCELEVQEAIVRVLQVELGLDVLIGPGSTPVENDLVLRNSPAENKPPARRPENFGILKVTRTSLYDWLQKKKRH